MNGANQEVRRVGPFRVIERLEHQVSFASPRGNFTLNHSLAGRDDLPAIAAVVEAAPDLLAACRKLANWCDRMEEHGGRALALGEDIRAARAAIAKAGGG